MKILIISSGFFPITNSQGGAIEQLVDTYLIYNEALDDKITVYSPKISKDIYDRQIYNNTEFRLINKSTLRFKIKKTILKFTSIILRKNNANAFIREVVKEIKAKKEENAYDIIIFQNGVSYIEYFNKKTKTIKPIVLHLHNDYLNASTKNGLKIYNICSEIWTVSDYIKRRVQTIISNNDSKKIKVLYNMYDNKIFSKRLSKTEKEQMKRKLNITNDDKVCIYVGRVIPNKGVKEMIEAFNKACIQSKNIKLLIVGGNSSYNNGGKYFSCLKSIANDNVIFVGHVKLNELYKYYSIADIQIVPSLCNEAFGLILLEGMSFNLDIIATDVGAIKEISMNRITYINVDNIVKELTKAIISKSNSDCFEKKYDDILDFFSKEKYLQTFYNLIHHNDKKRR